MAWPVMILSLLPCMGITMQQKYEDPDVERKPPPFGSYTYNTGYYDGYPQYPQYLYQPYNDCRDEYRRYMTYLNNFMGNWADYESFPRYEMNKEDQYLWNSYSGSYQEQQSYPNDGVRPTKGPCCYHYSYGPTGPTNTQRRKTRQEYRTLSAAQRNSLHKAFISLHASGLDVFVSQHRGGNAQHAHGGAAFLPWHREFLLRLENALEQHGYTGGLPYFDSTLDQLLPDPSASAVWSDDYLGNADGTVSSGFAQYWDVINECKGIGSTLTRNMIRGYPGRCYLFTDFDINYVFSKTCFRDIVCNIDCKFEFDHNRGHSFVGGHMGNPNCAPSDPFFFMHHAFVDCIWEEFRQNYQQSVKEREYPSILNGDDIGGAGYAYTSQMSPFPGLTNAYGMQLFYESYYACAPRPIRCSNNDECNSEILWCNNGRCTAKVRQDGYCGNLPDDACAGPCIDPLKPACFRSICRCK